MSLQYVWRRRSNGNVAKRRVVSELGFPPWRSSISALWGAPIQWLTDVGRVKGSPIVCNAISRREGDEKVANDRIQLAMDICHGILKANHARYQLCHGV